MSKKKIAGITIGVLAVLFVAVFVEVDTEKLIEISNEAREAKQLENKVQQAKEWHIENQVRHSMNEMANWPPCGNCPTPEEYEKAFREEITAQTHMLPDEFWLEVWEQNQ